MDGTYRVPCEYGIRDLLIRVDPGALDTALRSWNQSWGAAADSLAIDGNTMCNAIDEAPQQTHIMSVGP